MVLGIELKANALYLGTTPAAQAKHGREPPPVTTRDPQELRYQLFASLTAGA